VWVRTLFEDIYGTRKRRLDVWVLAPRRFFSQRLNGRGSCFPCERETQRVGDEYGVRLRVVVKRLMRDREIVMYILLCDVPISWICFFFGEYQR
jgi:hypothetical protein